MYKVLLVLFFIGLWSCAKTQHEVGAIGGYTLSKARALYRADHQPSFVDKDFTEFSFCHTPYIGVFYQHTHKRMILQTGFSSTIIGAGNKPWSNPGDTYPWYHYYLTVPLMVGYQLPVNKHWYLNFKGGLDLGLQWGQPFIAVYGQPKYWGHIGAAAGVELEWKRYRLGVRGMWGLTDFIVLPPFRYRHTALTTYIGYTFYDSEKAKIRRSKRVQTERL